MAVVIDKDACTGCAACVDVCPTEAISIKDDKAVVDADACTDCLSCIDECPTEAISEG